MNELYEATQGQHPAIHTLCSCGRLVALTFMQSKVFAQCEAGHEALLKRKEVKRDD